MKKIIFYLAVIMVILFWSNEAQALSRSHHLYNIGRNLVKMSVAPLKGIFVTGPRNIKKAYIYEVYEREKIEDRGKLRYKLFGIWRAPGEEIKGIVTGVVEAVECGGEAVKEFTSIIWSD